MSDLVNPLIVAAVSGVTYVAYKHPEAYQRIDRWLTAAFAIWAVGLIVFTVGVAVGSYLMRPYMGANRDAEIVLVQTQFRHGVDAIAWPVVGVMLYSWFLSILPKILGLKKNKADDEGDQESP
jgi:hypothetical protein